MLVNLDGDISNPNQETQKVEAVTTFKYLGVELHSDCSARQKILRQVATRWQRSHVALQQIYGLCKQHGIRCVRLRLQLMQSFACSHLLFACAVWRHAFGAKLQLRAPAQSSCRKLSALHTAALRWSIRAPGHTRLLQWPKSKASSSILGPRLIFQSKAHERTLILSMP